MLKLFFIALFISVALCSSQAQEVLEWRGKDRTGYYPEKGLLKSWPTDGPELLWEFDGLGNGYSSPAITSENIYITGEIDTVNYLFCLNNSGKMIWKSKVGKEWIINYPGSRSTPTVVGSLVYTTAGWGTIACFDAKSGAVKWSADYIKDFNGRINRFGFSESVVVDGDLVFCTPGSADTNIVALNRYTGELQWICKGLGQLASYSSPLLIKLPERNILVTFTKSELLGIDTKNGHLLWVHKQDSAGDVHINTPFYEDGFIYYITGDGNGAVKLNLSADGKEISEIWRNKSADNTMGGFIKINDYIYSSGYEKRLWFSIDANTGKIVDSLKFDKGNTIAAENLLYLYNEKGNLALVKPTGPKLDIVSSFKITRGSKAHYSHPVINDGILYLRRGKSLLAYNIRNN
jgi:outer membrane protein assembly factor BamB